MFIPDVELLKQQQAPLIRFLDQIHCRNLPLQKPQALSRKADLFCRPEAFCWLYHWLYHPHQLGGVFSDCIIHIFGGPHISAALALRLPWSWLKRVDHADPQWRSSIFLAFRWGRCSHHEFRTAEVVGPSGAAALSSVLSKCRALLRHLRVPWMGFEVICCFRNGSPTIWEV